MKALLVLFAIALSSQAHAIGHAAIMCESKNVSASFAVPYNALSLDKIDVRMGQITFFGKKIGLSRIGPASPSSFGDYDPVLRKVVREDDVDQYDYDFFGGYKLLFQTGIYKFRLSVFRDHFKVYGVEGKVDIMESDLLEEGSCRLIGI